MIDRCSYEKCNKRRFDPVLVGLVDWIGFLIHVLAYKDLSSYDYLLQYITIRLHI